MAEDVRLMAAARTDVKRHVLDNSEHRNIHLPEHVEALARVQKRNVLRRGDDDGAGQRHLLSHRQLRVAGARRHVDDQDVQFAPGDVAQHLLKRRLNHGAAPDHRRILGHQKAHGHHLHAVVLERRQGLAVGRVGTAGDSHHARLARAVDIGVQQPDLEALGGEGEGQVGRGRRFADAALAAGHCDDVLHTRNQSTRGPARRLGLLLPRTGCRTGCRTGRRGATGWLPRGGISRLGGQNGGDGEHAFQLLDSRLRLFAQGLKLRTPFGIDLDREADIAVLHHQPLNHSEIDDVSAAVGILHLAQGVEHLVLGNAAHA